MIYQALLAIGFLGVLAMGLAGARGRGRGKGRGKGRGRGRGRGRTRDVLLGLFSPLTVFALCLGTGAAGMTLEAVLKTPWQRAVLAVVIGFLFWKLVVEPLEELVMRFASEPATNLEGAKASEATVQSRFDAQGRGMVSLTVDGQIRRVLAVLVDGDREQVQVGDKVVVVEVDTRRNTCRVARL